MKKTFKNFVAILAVISFVTVQSATVYANVPTTDTKVQTSTWKKAALTLKEIASLASTIFGLYSMIASLGEGFNMSGIASGVSGLANQASSFASAIDSTINKVDQIDAKVGEALGKYKDLVGSGDIDGASAALIEATSVPAGASVEEMNSHNAAMNEMIKRSAAETVAFADNCRSMINPAKSLQQSQTALKTAVDMAQRKNIANEIDAKRMVEAQTCSLMMQAGVARSILLKDIVTINTTAGSMTAE